MSLNPSLQKVGGSTQQVPVRLNKKTITTATKNQEQQQKKPHHDTVFLTRSDNVGCIYHCFFPLQNWMGTKPRGVGYSI
jgi:hypothetical protein